MREIYKLRYFLLYLDAYTSERFRLAKAESVNILEANLNDSGGYSSQKLDPICRDWLSRVARTLRKRGGHSSRDFAVWFLDTIFLVLAGQLKNLDIVNRRIAFLKGWLSI